MKKFNNPMANGLAPVLWNEGLNLILTDIYEILESLYPDQEFHSTFGNGDGVIISGCVTSDNGTNQDITAGVVWLPKVGKFLRVPAQTNVADPVYVTEDTSIITQRNFKDGTPRDYIVDEVSAVSGSAPGGNDYVRISHDNPENSSVRLKDMSQIGSGWITGTLVLGDFNSGVSAVNTATYKYKIEGKKLRFLYNFRLTATANAIVFTLPNSLNIVDDSFYEVGISSNSGGTVNHMVTASSDAIDRVRIIQRDNASSNMEEFVWGSIDLELA